MYKFLSYKYFKKCEGKCEESEKKMTTAKIEFAVQMSCESCVKAVKKCLEGINEIKSVDVNLQTGSVIVDTSLSAEIVLDVLQKSGKKAVIRGYGQLAAVAVLDAGNENVKGVVRFVQENSEICIVDGTIDGLKPGRHVLMVHECGDISKGCDSVGNYFNPYGNFGRIYGNLGCIEAQGDGRSAFRFDDKIIKLSDIIGRSLVISEEKSGVRLACGIIARSAGLFQNPKTICACDGVTIWNEKISTKAAL